jgi:hypothetical protein
MGLPALALLEPLLEGEPLELRDILALPELLLLLLPPAAPPALPEELPLAQLLPELPAEAEPLRELLAAAPAEGTTEAEAQLLLLALLLPPPAPAPEAELQPELLREPAEEAEAVAQSLPRSALLLGLPEEETETDCLLLAELEPLTVPARLPELQKLLRGETLPEPVLQVLPLPLTLLLLTAEAER